MHGTLPPEKTFSTNSIRETAKAHGAAAKIFELKIFELLSLYVGVHGDLHPKRHLPRNQRAHLRRRRTLDISA